MEQPRYWSWAKVALTDLNFREIFYSERLRNVPLVQLFLLDPDMKEDFFRSLRDQSSQLKCLEVCRMDLSALPLFRGHGQHQAEGAGDRDILPDSRQ